ncbi:Hypothetical_protein [Hexamita inflata]|uniref:Hypothetical_protein n=1 Tax=Hexamita inflata TaxID=28002 RepID=A0ABP1GHI9_9EUKA
MQIPLEKIKAHKRNDESFVQRPAELKPASAILLLKSKHKQASQDAIGKILIRKFQEQCCDMVEVIDIYVEDHPKSPISKIQSNLILILKAFYKRKLINRSQCEILLKKIKALQQVQNIEDVLKQASLNQKQISFVCVTLLDVVHYLQII